MGADEWSASGSRPRLEDLRPVRTTDLRRRPTPFVVGRSATERPIGRRPLLARVERRPFAERTATNSARPRSALSTTPAADGPEYCYSLNEPERQTLMRASVGNVARAPRRWALPARQFSVRPDAIGRVVGRHAAGRIRHAMPAFLHPAFQADAEWVTCTIKSLN